MTFTPQQAKIAALVSRGLSNEEIANSLQLSICTVRAHLQRLCEKRGISTRTAVAMAIVAQLSSDEKEKWLSSELGRTTLAGARRLTQGQREVLDLLIQAPDFPLVTVAERLYMSEAGVKYRLRSARRHMGIATDTSRALVVTRYYLVRPYLDGPPKAD